GSVEVFLQPARPDGPAIGRTGWLDRLRGRSRHPSGPPGSGRPIARIGPGELFGEMTCLNHYPRPSTVRAARDCEVLELLRNVLYVMQRSRGYRDVLERTYREHAIVHHLRSVPILAPLRDDPARFDALVEELRPKVQLVRCDPGQLIIRQDDPA